MGQFLWIFFSNLRRNVMATFFKRGPYQWQVKIRRKGSPVQTKTFNTRAEAEAWARLLEGEMDRGAFVSRKEAENTTLEETLTRYQKEISENKKGAYQESRRIETFKNHKIGKRFLSTIQGKTIAEFRDERLSKVSEATVRRELVILSNLFEIARKEWGNGGWKGSRIPFGVSICLPEEETKENAV
jgi:hypothetical protein